MRTRFKRFAILSVFPLCFAGGCVSWHTPDYPQFDKQSSLADAESRAEIVRDKLDRASLRAKVGDPTIDGGEEWVYVGRFHYVEGIPFTMLLSVYDNRWDDWGMTVVTFDTAGRVSNIRFETIRSELLGFRSWWTIFNVHFTKNNRVRALPATQAAD